MQTYAIDILALPLISLITMKFWCALFGVKDLAFVLMLMAAGLGDALARLAAARNDRRRPTAFCIDRRGDLLAGILIGIGPWPIGQVIGSSLNPVWEPLALAPAIRLIGMLAILMMTARRLAGVRQETTMFKTPACACISR